MQAKAKIELTQATKILGHQSNYRVDRMTNTTEFQIGEWIRQEKVDQLIQKGYTVIVSGKK
jgi:hypothetical protein